MTGAGRVLVAGALGAITLAGCAPVPEELRSATPTPSAPASSESADPTAAACADAAAGLSLEQQVGQLFMVGVNTEGLDETTRAAISAGQIGSVVLLGNNSAGSSSIRELTAQLGSLGSAELPLLVAVDQEGGTVQRLQGEGFSTIPPAREQGGWPAGELESSALQWGGELTKAGVHYDLAPVADVVPVDKRASNAPIGALKRDFGSDPQLVARSVTEFISGMHEAGIVTSVKHFPGLGEVSTNTDLGAATDDVTTRDGASLAPFTAAIDAGVDSVMVSSAVFTQIDPDNEGVFSSTMIEDFLRGELGFDKVVIADDLGAAQSVKDVTPAQRAVRFFRAGGDLAINADPQLMAQMVTGTLDEAVADDAFAQRVTESAARVLALKKAAGLGTCG